MSKNGKLLILAALAVLASGCAQFFNVVGKPEVTAVRPRITGIDLQGVNIEFDVDIHNPYVVPLASPSVHYGLDIEGVEFIKGDAPITVALPAQGVGTAVLPVRLDYLSLWNTHKKLSVANQFAYTLHGDVAVSALGQSYTLPLSHSGTLPVLRPPKLSNISVQFSDVSLRSAAVTVSADVENPNVFALGVKNVGYLLKLGETQVGGLTAASGAAVGPGESGRVTLSGRLSAADALLRLATGGSAGAPKLTPSGAIETPYGPVKLP